MSQNRWFGVTAWVPDEFSVYRKLLKRKLRVFYHAKFTVLNIQIYHASYLSDNGSRTPSDKYFCPCLRLAVSKTKKRVRVVAHEIKCQKLLCGNQHPCKQEPTIRFFCWHEWSSEIKLKQNVELRAPWGGILDGVFGKSHNLSLADRILPWCRGEFGNFEVDRLYFIAGYQMYDINTNMTGAIYRRNYLVVYKFATTVPRSQQSEKQTDTQIWGVYAAAGWRPPRLRACPKYLKMYYLV